MPAAATSTARTTIVSPEDTSLRQALTIGLIFAAIKLALHLITNLWEGHIGYGYFRDEFYYLICGRHLAWGYVDHGPIVGLQARIAETVLVIPWLASELCLRPPELQGFC